MTFKTLRLVLLFLVLVLDVSAQQKSMYYVVIGGFRNVENAKRYTVYAQSQKLPAEYSLNPERQIFYVFVKSTPDKMVAFAALKDVKGQANFKDAWVFYGMLEDASLTSSENVIAEEPPLTLPSDGKDVSNPTNEPEIKQVTTEEVVSEVKKEEPVEVKNEIAEPVKPAGKPFVFKLLNSSGDNVSGVVRLQESEKSNQYRGFRGNEMVYVVPPGNRNGKWYVVCQVVGYKKSRKVFSYKDAQQAEGASIGANQEVVIPLTLTRVKKGDYIEMDEVKFFNNSSVFMPGSERELEELVTMMNENTRYKIRIHGHTNGDQPRDIVALGSSTDFFAHHETNEKTSGTAKQLSQMRAETLKAYLISKGIEGSRISVKGEGGKQMIFDPKGTNASGNDRVEIEILRH